MIRGNNDIAELIKKISRFDDSRALKLFFDQYYAWLLTVSISIVKVRQDAEEVVEDVFFKIWEKRRMLDKIKNIETYLYTAVKNKSLNRYKSMTRIKSSDIDEYFKQNESATLDYYTPSPEEVYLYEELKGKIQQAIDKLPPKCRESFNLIKTKKVSYKEAAAILKLSPRTIENQVHIAIKKIASEIQGYMNDY